MILFHFLRPWWLVLSIPLLVIGFYLWHQNSQLRAWAQVCDPHLLKHLLQSQPQRQTKRKRALILLIMSGLLMLVSLAGPTWFRLPVPTYHAIQPVVVVLDMSEAMSAQDLSPDRLSRAKFKLHDLFQRRYKGQIGLVAYTGEPFVVAPLTEDAQTIDALISSLHLDIMPVSGVRLSSALTQAKLLLTQAGFNHGRILVLAAEPPDQEAIQEAERLSSQHIFTSVMPIVSRIQAESYQQLALAGKGELLLINGRVDLNQWLDNSRLDTQYSRNFNHDIPLWQDEGRWFLLPAFLCLLPVFWRGWLERIVA